MNKHTQTWRLFASLIMIVAIGCDDDAANQNCVGATCAPVRDASISTIADGALNCVDGTEEGRVVGNPCGCGGTWSCDGRVFECIGGSVQNECGGCAELVNEPGRACGECSDGTWRCETENELVCDGATARDACGGCSGNTGQIGETCGACGTLSCDENNRLTCE